MENNGDARNQIFAAIRKSRERGGGKADPAAVAKRLAEHPAGIIPKRSRLGRAAQVNLFQKMAENVAASVVRLSSDAAIPDAVSDYLAQKNLPARVKLSGDEALSNLPWSEKAGHISLTSGASGGADPASLVVAFAGIAETGTLMLHSGPKGPTTLNFLPETHMVVLPENAIVGAYEEAWARLRKQQAAHGKGKGFLPRTVNMITGPSRTGDIEQTIFLGAHGPNALHILVVADGG